MPHLVVEYGRQLPDLPAWPTFFQAAHAALAGTGHIVPAEIKSRAVPLDDCYVGDGDPTRGFVHIRLYMLDNRSDAQKQAALVALREVAQQHFGALLAHPEQEVCLELLDIRAPYYAKLIS
ncbi:5-carboxymethyl-2-hydroxymuconate Delta-isomerase [Chitinimonas sp.]|uniref:5-carboxymethyl-2-hydroxymuconate Delta-isomerase n=1 Tax=Chitinimonas sp. TaxID=1934313 RepID=UPI0035B4ED8F